MRDWQFSGNATWNHYLARLSGTNPLPFNKQNEIDEDLGWDIMEHGFEMIKAFGILAHQID